MPPRLSRPLTLVAIVVGSISGPACTVRDPLYCDENTPCTSADGPFCDIRGEYPESEGIARTCIADPGEGTEPDAGDMNSDGGPVDGGLEADASPPCVPRLVFRSERDDNSDIYVTDADGTNQINLTQSPAQDLVPEWSPDGSKLVFTRDFQIWTMNADGSNARQIVLRDETMIDVGPRWSPDGARIAFTRLIGSDSTLSVVPAGGGEPVPLAGEVASPEFSWSPDGARLAYVTNRDGNLEVYTVNSDGSNQTNRTDSTADDGIEDPPIWSPDGERIFFISDRSGSRDIWSMQADGGDQRNLTNSAVNEGDPNFWPDGSKIVYVRQIGNASELYSMNPDGTGQRNLTNDSTEDKEPALSPDGMRLAWSAYRDGNFEIYVANSDGSEPVRVTSNQFTDDDDAAAWQPCNR